MSLSWLDFGTKLVGHVGSVPAIIGGIDSLTEAGTLQEKWDATKTLGDLLVPIVSSVTGFSHESEESLVSALGIFDGSRIGKIKKFVESPMGQMLIGLLLKQLAG